MWTSTREYHQQRRANAKRLGICIQCNCDPAEPGKTKCAGCRIANYAKRPHPIRNNSEIVRKGNLTRKLRKLCPTP